jgi:hypothetical protein
LPARWDFPIRAISIADSRRLSVGPRATFGETSGAQERMEKIDDYFRKTTMFAN